MIKTVIVVLLLAYQCMPSTYKKEKPQCIWTADWSPDGKSIAFRGDDSTLRWSPDGEKIITGTFSEGIIQVWTKDARLIKTIE